MTAAESRAVPACGADADTRGAGAADFDDALAAPTGGLPSDPREAARHHRRPARLLPCGPRTSRPFAMPAAPPA